MNPNELPADSTAYHQALALASEHWALRSEQTSLIRDGVNHVYGSVTMAGEPMIVRISDGDHHALNDIEAELIWLDYLIANGCVVTTPVRSQQGLLVESVEIDAGLFHVSCFMRFGGEQLDPRSSPLWNEDFLFRLGRIIGRLHRLTDEFQLPPDKDRMPWWETELHNFPKPLPTEFNIEVIDRMQVFLDQLIAKPRPDRHFGLIHHDIHSGNILIEDGEIQLIDFDLACYGWRMTDFAVLLYNHYYFPSLCVPDASVAKASQALRQLARGYREEYILDDAQLEMIPTLMLLRETLLYNILRPNIDHWQIAFGNPTFSAAQSLHIIEQRWLMGTKLEIDLGQVTIA